MGSTGAPERRPAPVSPQERQRGPTHVVSTKVSFAAQTGALFRKHATYQWRNTKQNLG